MSNTILTETYGPARATTREWVHKKGRRKMPELRLPNSMRGVSGRGIAGRGTKNKKKKTPPSARAEILGLGRGATAKRAPVKSWKPSLSPRNMRDAELRRRGY